MKDLSNAREKAKSLDRKALLSPSKPISERPKRANRPVLVLTYNPANPNMKNIIEKHLHLIERSRFKDLFNEKPLIAYRRNKNLSDTLVRAKCNNITPTTSTKTFTPPMLIQFLSQQER